jgi:adenosine deaminase
MSDPNLDAFIRGIPKCELHMHLLGNIEPEMVFHIANRNGMKLPYESAEHLRMSYNFNDLGEFLAVFRQGTDVIQTEADLYDITWDYLTRAKADNCHYCELYYTPHWLIASGMTIESTMNGVTRAMDDARIKLGIESAMIFSCLRNLPEAEAFRVLELVKPWRKYIVAVGLASAELPFPPKLFVKFFDACRQEGFKVTIHAGEEGPVEYIDQALTLLKADRIDHGNACQHHPSMIERLRAEKVPLTMCPFSNLRLNLIENLSDHPLKKLLDAGLLVSVNSDDPAFFGGYVNDNYIGVQKALGLTREDIIKLAKNSFESSFLSDDAKLKGIQSIDDYVLSSVL